ncbi:MAG TPA: CHASE3 domain-containing protein [Chitinophagaceae bacterium]|nr:CHASE3 domain-containing protein [Chitinophagaceae bacterium]
MKSIIDKLKIHNRIRVGYGTAFFLLLICYLITLYNNQLLLRQAEYVDHTNNTIIQLEKILSDIKDGETGIRGYAVMKDPRFLDSYLSSKTHVDTTFASLRRMTTENPLQQRQLDTLSSLIRLKFSLMQNGILQLERNQFTITDSLYADINQGKMAMDSIRGLVSRMQHLEEKVLTLRKDKMENLFSSLRIVIIVSLLIACLLLVMGFITYIRENKARREADEKVQQYQEQLRVRIMELRGVNKELLQMRSIEKFASTGRIARTIAHEVRNPLTNINLAMEQLKAELPEGEDNQILFEMVNRNSNRINQLITDLLNSTKFAELTYGKTSINVLLDEALELAKDRISLYNITVVKKYSMDICDVAVDKDKLKIAFLNIIVNAIEAMEPGKGVLTVTTRGENNKCVIEIADNGSGMDKESLSRLFEPYFTSKPKGNGLGLTNTQNIILNHKGTIQAESEKGQGTTFTITLDFVA